MRSYSSVCVCVFELWLPKMICCIQNVGISCGIFDVSSMSYCECFISTSTVPDGQLLSIVPLLCAKQCFLSFQAREANKETK